MDDEYLLYQPFDTTEKCTLYYGTTVLETKTLYYLTKKTESEVRIHNEHEKEPFALIYPLYFVVHSPTSPNDNSRYIKGPFTSKKVAMHFFRSCLRQFEQYSYIELYEEHANDRKTILEYLE